jgi:predicted RNase H-like nuclease (RuvC/YqgF family)
MFEQIEQLEGRVNALVGTLEEARRQIAALRQENRRLQGQLDEKTAMEQRNAQLQRQMDELQRDLEDKSQKESQIRERLKGILGRIESLEQEAGRGGEA